MDTQQPSAPRRPSGLIHVNVRHTTRYTVVGNHLAQHRKLSLLAIGLAVHLQSLPAGASVGIKALAAKFPESELRIAGAMRELERHGYLERFNERLPNGRLAPRTISYNRPGAEPGHAPTTPEPPPDDDPPPPEPPDAPPPDTPAPAPPPDPPQPAKPAPRPVTPAPHPPAPQPSPPQPPPSPPLPQPLPQAHRPAADLLARLRVHEPRLLLAERDIHRLAPGVAAWLERGAHPDAVLRTLAAALPDNLVHPAGLLAHRLTALLPPPLPARPPAPDPLQNCDTCDRAFRSAEPGRCRDCRPHEKKAA
ncbi:helix-turn-helix domain-containing protein [Streptomyces sp. NBC_01353]|uniref:helix-turn-helix domain-containing protein n=1 Tax=Streptomyces sp. NBC_01353 TaxID=2903835 RepID=UPI002E370AE8|nr:helix-turn-helix domain-containing protein [Streptomyces sp. NBC_01353]